VQDAEAVVVDGLLTYRLRCDAVERAPAGTDDDLAEAASVVA
jgi:hypothetical protein